MDGSLPGLRHPLAGPVERSARAAAASDRRRTRFEVRLLTHLGATAETWQIGHPSHRSLRNQRVLFLGTTGTMRQCKQPRRFVMTQTEPMERQPGAPYVVPKRFGLRTLLFVTTFFGLIFAAAKSTPAPAVALIFYSSFLVFISLSQMLLPQYPRLASILAGAVFMPAGVYGAEFTPLGAEFILKIVHRWS